jgi:hypothetical protein
MQTKCESMIKAFAAGGDFHSRTAMGMYQHVAEAVRSGDVLLEWEDAGVPPPKPMLKNVFGSERRKAKVSWRRCGVSSVPCRMQSVVLLPCPLPSSPVLS